MSDDDKSLPLDQKLEREFHRCWTRQRTGDEHGYNKDAFREFQATINEVVKAIRAAPSHEAPTMKDALRMLGDVSDDGVGFKADPSSTAAPDLSQRFYENLSIILAELEFLDEGSGPNTAVDLARKAAAEIKARRSATVTPAEPPKGLLVSIALRLDHGLFATPPYSSEDRKRYIEVALDDARKAWEEVTGKGFWSPESNAEYEAMLATPLPGPHEPPMVYDPKQGKMVKPGATSDGGRA